MYQGDVAPDFALKIQRGETISLRQFRGKKVTLYFYVRDYTPGCTKEACDLRGAILKIEKNNAVVLSVSPDDEDSHAKFAKRYSLPFHLLADRGAKVARLYGVYGKKTLYGKNSLRGQALDILHKRKGQDR